MDESEFIMRAFAGEMVGTGVRQMEILVDEIKQLRREKAPEPGEGPILRWEGVEGLGASYVALSSIRSPADASLSWHVDRRNGWWYIDASSDYLLALCPDPPGWVVDAATLLQTAKDFCERKEAFLRTLPKESEEAEPTKMAEDRAADTLEAMGKIGAKAKGDIYDAMAVVSKAANPDTSSYPVILGEQIDACFFHVNKRLDGIESTIVGLCTCQSESEARIVKEIRDYQKSVWEDRREAKEEAKAVLGEVASGLGDLVESMDSLRGQQVTHWRATNDAINTMVIQAARAVVEGWSAKRITERDILVEEFAQFLRDNMRDPTGLINMTEAQGLYRDYLDEGGE